MYSEMHYINVARAVTGGLAVLTGLAAIVAGIQENFDLAAAEGIVSGCSTAVYINCTDIFLEYLHGK